MLNLKNMRIDVMAVMTGLCLLGCAEVMVGGDADGDLETVTQEEAWNRTNDPALFEQDLVYEIDQLPVFGEVSQVPWPSYYWATYQDAINYRWNDIDELSPAEKYDLAFNDWTPPAGFSDLTPYTPDNCGQPFDEEYYHNLGPLATHVSTYMGNLDAHDGSDSDGDRDIDECPTVRDPDYDGLETWFGLCHAWVPAAILEQQPLHSVTYNGVTFHPADLEALVIAAYNENDAIGLGGRCNSGSNQLFSAIRTTRSGRVVSSNCRDLNPGAFHVIVANYLGLMDRPFAEDRTYDYQVWNQPVVAFESVISDPMDYRALRNVEGIQRDLGLRSTRRYPYNRDAVSFRTVETALTYLTESAPSTTATDPEDKMLTDHYTYVLELDSAGRIIGGEWTGDSRTDHPDFFWDPQPNSESSVPYLDLDTIRMLIEMSRP